MNMNWDGNFLTRVIEPATLLTVTIGGAYFLGWIQIESYCYRIGLSHVSLNLPTTYYLIQGYLGAFVLSFTINLYQWKGEEPPESRPLALLVNFSSLGGLFLLLIFGLFTYTGFFWPILIVFAILFSVSFVCSLSMISLPNLLLKNHSVGKSYLLFIFCFAFLSLNSYVSGIHSAERTLEGKSGIAITLNGIDDLNQQLAGKDLILVLHNDSTYFVVERSTVAQSHPNVYVIPDESVRFVKTTAVSRQ